MTRRLRRWMAAPEKQRTWGCWVLQTPWWRVLKRDTQPPNTPRTASSWYKCVPRASPFHLISPACQYGCEWVNVAFWRFTVVQLKDQDRERKVSMEAAYHRQQVKEVSVFMESRHAGKSLSGLLPARKPFRTLKSGTNSLSGCFYPRAVVPFQQSFHSVLYNCEKSDSLLFQWWLIRMWSTYFASEVSVHNCL